MHRKESLFLRMWPKVASFYAVGKFTVCKGFDSATFLQVISLSLFKLIVTDDSQKCYLKPEPKYYLASLQFTLCNSISGVNSLIDSAAASKFYEE